MRKLHQSTTILLADEIVYIDLSLAAVSTKIFARIYIIVSRLKDERSTVNLWLFFSFYITNVNIYIKNLSCFFT